MSWNRIMWLDCFLFWYCYFPQVILGCVLTLQTTNEGPLQISERCNPFVLSSTNASEYLSESDRTSGHVQNKFITLLWWWCCHSEGVGSESFLWKTKQETQKNMYGFPAPHLGQFGFATDWKQMISETSKHRSQLSNPRKSCDWQFNHSEHVFTGAGSIRNC